MAHLLLAQADESRAASLQRTGTAGRQRLRQQPRTRLSNGPPNGLAISCGLERRLVCAKSTRRPERKPVCCMALLYGYRDAEGIHGGTGNSLQPGHAKPPIPKHTNLRQQWPLRKRLRQLSIRMALLHEQPHGVNRRGLDNTACSNSCHRSLRRLQPCAAEHSQSQEPCRTQRPRPRCRPPQLLQPRYHLRTIRRRALPRLQSTHSG